MEQRGPGHTVESGKIYEKGFLGYRQDIIAAIGAMEETNEEDVLEKREELEAMVIAYDAVITLGERFVALAEERVRRTDDGDRRGELLRIAENCRVLPAHRPRSFGQAIQMYWFVHLCVTTEINPWDSYGSGRLDRHL